MTQTVVLRQAEHRIPWLHVRFEQGRGRTGVPKTWVPYLVEVGKQPAVVTLVRQAVGLLRAQCADPNQGHGRDLMPGTDDEYALHNVDGGLIQNVEDIKWQASPDGVNRAELVLTWRNPAELLAQSTR